MGKTLWMEQPGRMIPLIFLGNCGYGYASLADATGLRLQGAA